VSGQGHRDDGDHGGRQDLGVQAKGEVVTRRFLWSGAILYGVSCGAPPASVTPPAAAEDEQPPERGSEQQQTRPPATPLLSNCVLHAGQSSTRRRREKTPGGELGPSSLREASCSFNAECIAQPGEANPGDGFASLACSDGRCSCRLEPALPAGTVVAWEFRAPCNSAGDAELLLRDQCLQGTGVTE
jgi:hypothetical protein